MAKAANFTVIFDKGRTTRDHLKGITFNIPQSCDLDEQSILMFMVEEALSDSGRLEIVINELILYKKGLSEDPTYYSAHEVLPAKALRHGENSISFRVKSDEETYVFLRISDVVLWWQENV